jgi:membrane protease YdiL (CAAX protease family)
MAAVFGSPEGILSNTPVEVAVAFLAFAALWIALAAAVTWAPGWRRSAFGQRAAEQRRPALAIALVYLVAGVLGSGLDVGRLVGLAIGAVSVFAQALLGLAVARGIAGFEPLPVWQAFRERRGAWRAVLLLLVIGVAAGFVALVVGSVSMSMGREVFHETSLNEQVASEFPANKLQAFFLLLSGAGIAEETTYRLLAVSAVWLLFKRRWLAILVGALLFAAYHLTPLDGYYLYFWQYPVSQFLGSALIGLIWGWLYTRRGYETAVLGHTMSDTIGVVFFM